MRCPLIPHRALHALVALLCCWCATAETLPAYEAIWYLKGESAPGRKVSAQVQGQAEAPVTGPYTCVVAIESKLPYRNALVSMSVEDAAGKAVLSGEQELPLPQGATRCSFDLDPAKLGPGHYTAKFTVQYTDQEDPAMFTAHLRRVSSGDLGAQLEKAQAALAPLAAQDAGGKPSYASLRVRIAQDFAAKAGADAAAGHWQAFAEKVDYATKVAGGAGADLSLSGLLPETVAAPADPALNDVEIAGAGYQAGGAPVFLIGGAVETPEGAAAARRYGLNYGVVTLRPGDALDAGADKDAGATFGPLFTAAANANLAVGVRLDAGSLAGWPQERFAGANADGFTNLAREDVQALVSRHLKAVLPYLDGQAGVAGVSLFDAPQFKFTGEKVHRDFIESVRTMYPDRQKLNAQWSAHLADYSDITLWGQFVDGRPAPKIPDHHYEKKRAYTFDWTAFHLGLMQAYLERVAAEARGLAPGLALSVTAPDTDFDKNQTAYSPDREVLARGLNFTSTTLTAGAADPVYGLGYPHASAELALLQSLDDTKPVNVERLNVSLEETMDAGAMHDFLQALVWNSVIDGADALALPADSDVYAHPAALEGYASAAMDINRLAPVVAALQHAPTDVSILYSDSSKILDGGDPHLKSCSFAYEGCSFSGLTVRYITERQCVEGKLDQSKVVVLPETPALRGETFKKLEAFVDGGGVAARVGSPIPYDEHGRSRTSVIRNTGRTLIVRGFNLPTEYLHAMDGINELAKLPTTPRPVNGFGYPLEGVKARFVEFEGEPYLYLANLRKDAVNVYLTGGLQSGRDVVRGHDVTFPTYVEPLHPMVIKLNANAYHTELAPVEAEKKHKRKK